MRPSHLPNKHRTKAPSRPSSRYQSLTQLNEVPATDGDKKAAPKNTEAEDLYKEIFKQIAQREKVERLPVDALINIPNTTARKSKRDAPESSIVQPKPEEKPQPQLDAPKSLEEDTDQNMMIIPM